MGSFTKLKRILEEKERFVLVYHIEPDGDAIGSAFALSEYLENQGKKVFLVGRDQIPSAFSFLETKYTILSELPHEDYEVIVLLDNGDAKRTGFPQEIMEQKAQGKIVVNIDHHSRNDLWRMVSVNYADETASSTSEIIYRVLIGLKAEMSRSIATNLLAGIYNDTGGFKHSNTTEQVLAIVADLLKRGGQLNKIAEKVENSRPVSLFKLWGIALLRLHYSLEWQVSVTYINQADLALAGASEEDVSGLVNLLNSAPESKAALLLYETKDGKIKGSFRTERDDVDVANLARFFGGGGHKKAAGFLISGRIVSQNGQFKIV